MINTSRLSHRFSDEGGYDYNRKTNVLAELRSRGININSYVLISPKNAVQWFSALMPRARDFLRKPIIIDKQQFPGIIKGIAPNGNVEVVVLNGESEIQIEIPPSALIKAV